jgi:EmrB/QacA subfamily drug resistance transporter
MSARHTRLTITLAVLGVFVTYIPITGVAVSLTTIGAATGTDTAGLQWVTDSYVIPMAAAVLSAGVFGDLYGRRRVFLTGMILSVLGAAIAVVAGLADTSIVVLWIGQAVAGLGGGLLLPTTLALIAHAVPNPKERGRFISLWATGMVAGLAVGPLIAGSITQNAGWGWIYVPTGGLAVLATIAALMGLPESKSPAGRHLDWPGQITATLAIVGLIYGVIEGGASGWTALQTIIGLAVGVVSLAAFIVFERRTSKPLLDLALFRSGAFTATALAAFVALFAIVGTSFLLSIFLGSVQHLDALEIGLRLLFISGVAVVVNPIVGALMHRVRPILLLGVGLVVAALGVFLLTSVEADVSFGNLAWRLSVFGISLSLMLSPVSLAAINSVPWQQAGMAAAANTAMRQCGGAFGPAVLGVVFADHFAAGNTAAESFHVALILNIVLLLVAAVTCLAAGAKRAPATA